MDESEEILGFLFVTGDKTPIILEPSMQAFCLPAAVVSTQSPAVLMSRVPARAAGGNNRQDIAINEEATERVGIVAAICDHDLRKFRNKPVAEDGWGELHFRG